MVTKTDDNEQNDGDVEQLNAAKAAIRMERKLAQDALYQKIVDMIPEDMSLEDVSGVFLKLLAVGIIQVHDRVYAEALAAARRLGGIFEKVVRSEWGGKGHQSLLASRSREVQ